MSARVDVVNLLWPEWLVITCLQTEPLMLPHTLSSLLAAVVQRKHQRFLSALQE